MSKYWRYFRIEGDPPRFAGENLFTLSIHHGGRMYSNGGIDMMYKGGEVLYIDGIDPEKMAMTELNSWAYDIGYCEKPIAYWYRISGENSGILPLKTYAEMVDMFMLAPKCKGELDLFIVCLATRRDLQELMLEGESVVDRWRYFGHFIEGMPLSIHAHVVVEEEHIVEEHAELNKRNGCLLNNEKLMDHIFGEANGSAEHGEWMQENAKMLKEHKNTTRRLEVENVQYRK